MMHMQNFIPVLQADLSTFVGNTLLSHVHTDNRYPLYTLSNTKLHTT